MKEKSVVENLSHTILLLEVKQAEELSLLKRQFHDTYESLRPINLIKTTFKEVTQSPEIKDNIENNLIGLATGYLTKKALIGKSSNPIKNIAGILFQIAVSNVAAKHTEGIKAAGKLVLNLFSKSDKSEKSLQEDLKELNQE